MQNAYLLKIIMLSRRGRTTSLGYEADKYMYYLDKA